MMRAMERVLVIGSPGSGKSIFARKLALRTGLPLIHLDAEYHQPGWIEPSPDKWDATLSGILGGESWIIDGNYGSSLKRRLLRADTVIVLDYPTRLCLWRLLKRIARHYGSVREDAAPGCPERFDWEFIRYVAAFRRTKIQGQDRQLAAFTGKTVRFRKPREAKQWLEGIAPLG
ncbi:adenylate kinase [Porphyrobacter algicida]|uniref:Adenylate kinase n=1 Tax=Qipengyuania algicida TaxID=1836209 RepID=A0A845AD73_9SPHN|nr:adenylate kinase [Qipengyuania algicida]MXP28402.1 adenylate kinase [Qipengyuania algicida]